MEYHLYPRDHPYDWDDNLLTYIYIQNAMLYAYYTNNLEWQYANNKILLNGRVGGPSPDHILWPEMRSHAGVFLCLRPKKNLTNMQYLVIFKAEEYPSQPGPRKFQIYHNLDLAGERTLDPGDDTFVITADARMYSTYLFFSVANYSYPLFKEIAVHII